MDIKRNNDKDDKPSITNPENGYVTMKNAYIEVWSNNEGNIRAETLQNTGKKTKCRERDDAKLKFKSQRQSEQMENFVENFIKPKLSSEKLKTSQIPNANLSQDIKKRVSKKKTYFNLMILGEKGLGKRTFIEALVKNKVDGNDNDKDELVTDTKCNDSKQIVERPYVLMKEGQKLYINIIQVPEFGVALNNETAFVDLLQYVDNSFEECFKQECSLDRSATDDRNIHCCLYFISPFGHSLKPLDVAFFKLFQSKINIIPIVAKCDAFIKKELHQFKLNVQTDLKKHGIDLFEYLNNSDPIEDEMDDIREICEEIKNNCPFVLTSSIDMKQFGKRDPVSFREYPWGVVKPENPDFGDFSKLENILTRSHINAFKKLTKTVHYENFRMKYIMEHVK